MKTTITYLGELTAVQKDALKNQLSRGERDRPLVFKGRENVLVHIETQLQKLQTSPEAIDSNTQVIHGAPGVGKTSLLTELKKKYGSAYSGIVVIGITGKDLASKNEFVGSVLGSLEEGVNGLNVKITTKKSGGFTAYFVKGDVVKEKEYASPIESMNLRTIWASLYELLDDDRVLLLCVDEAQTIETEVGKKNNPILMDLHTRQTNKLRVLPIFAGLNDTESILENEGLSRLDGKNTFHLSSLSLDEAKGVVKGVFNHDSLGLTNLFSQEDINLIAVSLATASQWPRHLHYYIEGVLQEIQSDQQREIPNHFVDLTKALEYGHQERVNYYDNRARSMEPEFVEAISKLLQNPSQRLSKKNLHNIARDHFDMSDEQYNSSYQKAIHNGIIEEIGSGSQCSLQMPTPSLRTFLLCDCDPERTLEVLRQDHQNTFQRQLT